MSTTDSRRWTHEQLRLAFHLYCQLPFGKLHAKNPEIVELAELIGRTPGAVAMKLVNFASLDPAVTTSGRKGLGNASAADREVWNECHRDWEHLALESAERLASLRRQAGYDTATQAGAVQDYSAVNRPTSVEVRVGQDFFRKAVLANYGSKCCMSGLALPRLLTASHIVPWAADPEQRLNPRNGLCLSAIHDRAFDQGLITVLSDSSMRVSAELGQAGSNELARMLIRLDGTKIDPPEKFLPSEQFLVWHNEHVFRDASR